MANSTKIDIPKQFITGISYISLLSEDNINSVYKALRQIPSGLSRKKYIKLFEEYYPFENSNDIGNSIFSFGGLINEPDTQIDDVAYKLSSSFEANCLENGIELLEGQIGILNNRLKYILLLSENLKAIFEVYELFDGQNSVINIELVSKANLLFDNNLKGKHGVVFHMLKVYYREENKSKSIFFTVDKNDLKNLKIKIEQAIEREDNIMLNNSELINFIDITD